MIRLNLHITKILKIFNPPEIDIKNTIHNLKARPTTGNPYKSTTKEK